MAMELAVWLAAIATVAITRLLAPAVVIGWALLFQRQRQSNRGSVVITLYAAGKRQPPPAVTLPPPSASPELLQLLTTAQLRWIAGRTSIRNKQALVRAIATSPDADVLRRAAELGTVPGLDPAPTPA